MSITTLIQDNKQIKTQVANFLSEINSLEKITKVEIHYEDRYSNMHVKKISYE